MLVIRSLWKPFCGSSSGLDEVAGRVWVFLHTSLACPQTGSPFVCGHAGLTGPLVCKLTCAHWTVSRTGTGGPGQALAMPLSTPLTRWCGRKSSSQLAADGVIRWAVNPAHRLGISDTQSPLVVIRWDPSTTANPLSPAGSSSGETVWHYGRETEFQNSCSWFCRWCGLATTSSRTTRSGTLSTSGALSPVSCCWQDTRDHPATDLRRSLTVTLGAKRLGRRAATRPRSGYESL